MTEQLSLWEENFELRMSRWPETRMRGKTIWHVSYKIWEKRERNGSIYVVKHGPYPTRDIALKEFKKMVRGGNDRIN